MPHLLLLFLFVSGFTGCAPDHNVQSIPAHRQESVYSGFDTATRTIHVMVALCDNRYQGIVPVPAKIGNGQDPANNLYWGCAYGVKTFFKQSRDWKLIARTTAAVPVLERLVFKHSTGWYLVADAYDGRSIRECTVSFLESCAGLVTDTLSIENKIIGIKGNSRMLAYVGHDGLMDFTLERRFDRVAGNPPDAIVLACYSRNYFGPHLQQTKARPHVWSTGLMSPEAYTLHAALDAYIKGRPAGECRIAAAGAYARYQHCSSKAAQRLLVTGY